MAEWKKLEDDRKLMKKILPKIKDNKIKHYLEVTANIIKWRQQNIYEDFDR